MAQMDAKPYYDEERVRQLAGTPTNYPGPVRGIPVPEAAPARIARLSKEVSEAAHQLDGARTTYDKASRNKEECQVRFFSLSEELLRAIHEHREGTAENAPYQP